MLGGMALSSSFCNGKLLSGPVGMMAAFAFVNRIESRIGLRAFGLGTGTDVGACAVGGTATGLGLGSSNTSGCGTGTGSGTPRFSGMAWVE